MRKILVLLTTEFPFGKSESFIASELKHFDAFDEILLCPMESNSVNYDRVQEVDKLGNVTVINCCKQESFISKSVHLLLKMLNQEFWLELLTAIKKSKNVKASIKELLVFSSKCDVLANNTLNSLKSFVKNDTQVYVYSYWLYQQAYAAVYLKNKLPNVCLAISRCHGFDVYEERHFGYIPFRRFLFDNLDRIYCISDDGQKYLQNNYPKYKESFYLSRLGTNDYGIEEYKSNRGILRIASCSYCVPIKRIDLIIKTLSILSNDGLQIEWIHFGDGEMFDYLNKLADSQLKNNIDWTLKGYCSNNEIIEEYQNSCFDLFLNVSSTEGIPVSIMEAMSFGIPVIATNVGGTKELVKDGFNGFLISPENVVEELQFAIKHIKTLPFDEYLKMRINARDYWKTNFFSGKNYRDFADGLVTEL